MATEFKISQPPSRTQSLTNSAFRAVCLGFTWLIAVVTAIIALKIVIAALPAMHQYGFGFLSGRIWDPNKNIYSILPEIWGTLYSSILALIVATAFGVAAALFLSEGFTFELVFAFLKLFNLQFRPFWSKLPEQAQDLLSNLIELLAAIPSVVYGLWGLFVLIPLIRPACQWLHADLGWIPLFSTNLSGPGMFPAVIVLSIMILPTITAIGRGALLAVPAPLRMAAYGLGATRWETIFSVTLPTASRGIFGGIVLAFGRALGETMALAMLVGNANVISVSLFSPADTLAALLANAFPEASPRDVGILMYAATVLLVITLLVNVAGACIVQLTALELRWKKI